jgi:ketosteroid isomerase-like protein
MLTGMGGIDTVNDYWAAAEARDWPAFGALLTDDVVYELPQTRERIRGRDAYLRFNREFPGDWHVMIVRATVTGPHASTWTSFRVDDEEMPGLCFFDFADDGRIAHITDFWPEPYDPPAWRAHLVERF